MLRLGLGLGLRLGLTGSTLLCMQHEPFNVNSWVGIYANLWKNQLFFQVQPYFYHTTRAAARARSAASQGTR